MLKKISEQQFLYLLNVFISTNNHINPSIKLTFYISRKKSKIKTLQIIIHSHYRFIIGLKILAMKNILHIWKQMIIAGRKVWRIYKMIQFDEACVMLDLWTRASSWGSSTPRVSFLQHFSWIEERNRWRSDVLHGPLIVVPGGRKSTTRRTPSQFQKMVTMILAVRACDSSSVWYLFTWFLLGLCFLLVEWIAVVYLYVFPRYNTTKKSS